MKKCYLSVLIAAIATFTFLLPCAAFADEANKANSSSSKPTAITTGAPDSSANSDQSEDEDTPVLPTGLKKGWNKVDGAWYLANAKGNALTSWQKVSKKWYYLDPKTAVMQTGWVDVDGLRYYLDTSGAMQTGWVKLAGTWYYLNGDGSMATEWKKVKGKWYYLDPETGAMKTGWLQLGKTWYYLQSSGAMKTGWHKSGSTWYYLKGSGAMATGWQKVGKTWYYLDPETGAMKTGWIELDGKWYYLYGSGAMAADTFVGGYYLASNGVWSKDPMLGKANSLYSSTNYVIIVDTKKNWVGVYKGKKGNRTQVKMMRCTSGAPATPTVKGEFTILDRKPSFGDGSYVVWNATRFYGGYFFHSVLYNPGSKTSIQDGRLGMNLSHGCVRLAYDDSRWIYTKIPDGTKVYAY